MLTEQVAGSDPDIRDKRRREPGGVEGAPKNACEGSSFSPRKENTTLRDGGWRGLKKGLTGPFRREY